MSRHGEVEIGEVSDDDSISITSTAASELRDEYPVDAIIAEEETDGGTQYLVRWEGYPDERCTWEPESSFQNEDTLLDWKSQKMRVSRGLATPCDVEALLGRVEEWVKSSERRKSRRRAKRIRLGITPMEVDVDEDSHPEKKQPETEPEQEAESDRPQFRTRTSSEKNTTPSRSRRDSDQTSFRVNSLRLGNSSKQIQPAWSDREEASLMEGLEHVNGPYYDQILNLFGPTGNINQSLKARSAFDLQIKTQNLYDEFQENEVEVPPWLRFLDALPETETNPKTVMKAAPTAVMFHPQRLDDQNSSRSKSTSKASSASPTKPDFAITRNTTQSERNTLPKKKLSTSSTLLDQDSVRISRPKVSSAQSPKLSTLSNRERLSRTQDINPFPTVGLKPSLSLTTRGLPPDQTSNSRSTPTTAGSVLPHSATRETQEPRRVQMGKSGTGPARLRLSGRKSPSTSSKRPIVSGAAILKNWNKQVKPRKSTSFQPTLSKVNENKQEKFGKLSVARKYEKAGRNEPAPEIDKLVFVDLKRAAKKPSFSLTELERPLKTPYEIIQEGLLQDKDESMLIDAPSPSLSETVVEQPASSATEPYDQNAIQPEKGASLQEDVDNSPAEASTHSTPGPRKRPSLPFEAYVRQTAPSVGTLSNNTVPASSEESPAETTLPERSPQHQETSNLQRDLHKPGPEPTMVFTKTSMRQETKIPSIRNISDSETKTMHVSESDELLHARREPSSATEAPPSDLPVDFSTEHGPLPVTPIPNSPARSQPITQGSGFSPTSYRGSGLDQDAQRPSSDVLILCQTDWAKGDIIGNVMIGPDRQKMGTVRFRGLNRTTAKLLIDIKVPPQQLDIWFKQICTAEDYRSFYHFAPNNYIEAGYIVPFVESMGETSRVAETLKLHASGGIFTSAKFSMLIYPADSGLESWAFLEELQPPVVPGAALRFVLRTPLPAPNTDDLDMEVKRHHLSFREGEGNTSMVLRNLLGIEYARLVKPTNSQVTEKSNNFFLLFPETAKREYHIIFKFLEEHQANIYTWQTDGAWDYFCNHIEAGAILIEGGFYELYIIPDLSRILRKSINVFNITFQADPLAPHPHINRLFPHGCALLITDSFLLLCPHQAARFMRWFRLWVMSNKPAGTWKLCTRPAIRDYLLSLVEDRNTEDGHIYMQIYENIWYLLPEELMEDTEWEVPKDGAPVYCMGSRVSNFDQAVGKGSTTNKPMNEDAIARNDATQVCWFAGWAMTQLEHFRRFHVISGARDEDGNEAERKSWAKKWSHINVLNAETTFKLYKIPEWEAQQAAKSKGGRNADRRRRGSVDENTGGRSLRGGSGSEERLLKKE